MSLLNEPEFDPEREATPERKRWSPEWLRADRERHEREETQEKNKKDRARELKQAAKKRGEELEKTQDHEHAEHSEPEIAPKGEKLRKKWRRAILRKSQQLLEFFRRDDPETIDGVQLAEVMVAERIVTLNGYLETTEPKTEERRSTKTELDFMGLLAEKLSSPDIEVPVEVEEVHRQIIEESQSVETAEVIVEEGTLSGAIGVETTEPAPAEKTAEPQHEAFVRHGGAVLAALRKVLRPREEPAVPSVGAGGGVSHSVTLVSSPVASSTPQPRAASPGRPLVVTAAVVKELRRPEAARPHAAAFERPLATNFSPVQPPEPSAVPVVTHQGERLIRPAVAEPVATSHETPVPYAERRFEHMETRELLELARDISVGNGQYLKRAYEMGQLDRDGLIRVLKAKKRGQDYVTQFRFASRAHHERLRAMHSPERLQDPYRASRDETRATAGHETSEPSIATPTFPETPPQQSAIDTEQTVDKIIDNMRQQAAREHPLPMGAILVGAGVTIATITVYLLFFR